MPRSSYSSRFWSPEKYFVLFSSLLFLEHHQRIYSICGCKQFVVPNRTVGVASCTPGCLIERATWLRAEQTPRPDDERPWHPPSLPASGNKGALSSNVEDLVDVILWPPCGRRLREACSAPCELQYQFLTLTYHLSVSTRRTDNSHLYVL